MQITIDDVTKLLFLSKLKINKQGRKDAAPIDFARDTILLIDDRTGRPVASIRPIVGANPAPSSPPRLAESKPNGPPSMPDGPPSTSPDNLFRGADYAGPGRLSDAHIEQLERLWRLNSGRTATWIAEEFRKQTGRAISEKRAERHRPDVDGPSPRDPSPDEIAERKKAILKGRKDR